MLKEVTDLLNEHNIKHEIKGRSKSIYSIYNKLDKGRKFSDIYDLLALRILVDTDAECYLVLGLIHSRFKPIAKRFKDFIAMPKSNGYQSLHTTVFGVNNELYEIQIRTYDMNEVAENGLAAHWSYKEHRSAFNLSNTDAKLEFFKAVIDTSKNSEYESFNPMNDSNLYDNIYVFTPKGDVIELPKGSTPVDFAYKVHSKIGDSMVGALVNNQIVPLNYLLQDSDVVKINTSKSSPGPSEDWLSFVKLNATKSKIKNFFAKTRKDELINTGKDLIDKELRKRKISKDDFYKEENEKKVLKTLKISSLEELYLEVASNKYNPKFVINIIYEEEKEEVQVNRQVIKNELDINVSGLSDIRVNIASCCKPLPGDDIVGYITRNNGITIHRKTCSNLLHLEERMLEVSFNPITKNKYLTSITIELRDNENKLMDILSKFTTKNIVMDEIKTFYHDNVIGYNMSFYINNLDNLNNLLQEIKNLKYVKEANRD
jgi:GTP pyrophosphokinase